MHEPESHLLARVQELLERSLGLRADQRESFVLRESADDEKTAREVLSLLDALTRAGDALEPPEIDGERSSNESLIGVMIGTVRIDELIGQGGMGAVYAGTDMRLHRRVAVKVLPASLATDADRRLRLEREARTLAALNCPGIATIYSIEDSTSGPVLIMEYVHGQTLAAKLKRSRLTHEQAVSIADAVLVALAAAHEAGVIHCDLTPSNIMLGDDGTVKVLDLGIALARQSEGVAESSGRAHVAGTPDYMSPEQARGDAVDRRTDMWSFGCVLFEMMAGVSYARCHPQQIEAHLERMPDAVRRVVASCLRTDVQMRRRDASDARIDLREPERRELTNDPARVPSIVIAISALVLILLAAWMTSPQSGYLPHEPPPLLTATLDTGDHEVFLQCVGGCFSLSPTLDCVVFTSRNHEGKTVLCVQELLSQQTRRIEDTEGAFSPCFTADGSAVVYYDHDDGQIRRVQLDNGAPIALCSLTDAAWGLCVARDGSVYTVGSNGHGLFRVDAAARSLLPVPVVGLNMSEVLLCQLTISADGRSLVLVVHEPALQHTRIASVDLESGTVRTIVDNASCPRVLDDGSLLFVRDGVIMHATIDPVSGTALGEPTTIVDGIGFELGLTYPRFDARNTSMLVFVGDGISYTSRSFLEWHSAEGERRIMFDAQMTLDMPRLSLDEQTVVYVATDEYGTDLWRVDIARRVPVRLTSGMHVSFPCWSNDGMSVLFAAPDADDVMHVWSIDAQGTMPARSIYTHTEAQRGIVLSEQWEDGTVALAVETDGHGTTDIFLLRPGSDSLERVFETSADRVSPRLSPDGTMLAYTSMETGGLEVYVESWPLRTRKVRVSSDGGLRPQWLQGDGTLVYRRAGDVFRAVLNDALVTAEPRRTHTGLPDTRYDITADGRDVLSASYAETTQPHSLSVRTSWMLRSTMR
ncbi:MAG: serine/threonine-protein kinase [Phycisphaeraceae bacterium]|nr:serine/threonine-protein kinase [Phycisphaerales bacterium]MCB9859228.1 serine/threonine-protein kinase [Phycisphaeraceae bacterium]